jgi:glucan phosphorylase
MKMARKQNYPMIPGFFWVITGSLYSPIVSGMYELITGEREWGRLNQSDTPNYGINSSDISISDKKGRVTNQYTLTGLHSLAAY